MCHLVFYMWFICLMRCVYILYGVCYEMVYMGSKTLSATSPNRFLNFFVYCILLSTPKSLFWHSLCKSSFEKKNCLPYSLLKTIRFGESGSKLAKSGPFWWVRVQIGQKRSVLMG